MRKLTRNLLAVFIIVSFLFPQVVLANYLDNDLEFLNEVNQFIKDSYKDEVTEEQIVNGALKGMFGNLDPYTTYYTKEEAESFLSSVTGEYSGIGIQFMELSDVAIVTKVFVESPAERAGLLTGDKIVGVDGESIAGLSLEEIAVKIKGPKGTEVELNVVRDGKDDILSIKVVREDIKVNPVTCEIKNDIGYITINSFNSNTAFYFNKAIEQLDEDDIKNVILDLRGNPGGEVRQAVLVAQYFVPQGLITRLDFKSEDQEDVKYYSYLKEKKYDLVVLVNGMTASASEILAGAVQDTDAGILLGTQTYGKSRVQNIIPLLTPKAFKMYKEETGTPIVDAYKLMTDFGIQPADDEILGWTKITTGEYLTPKGRIIDQKGLTPDIVVKDYEIKNGIDIHSVQKMRKKVKPSLNEESVDVYNAEKILKVLDYKIDKPDMLLDKTTFEAIKSFQRDSGLYPYGVLDYITQQKLNESLNELTLEIDKQFEKAVELLN